MLTDAQYVTLKANILADPALANAVATANDQAIADAYNATSSPVVKIWKPVVTIHELNSAIVWTAFTAMTVQQQNTYMAMTQSVQFLDFTDGDIRTAFATLFGVNSATVTAGVATAQKNGTRFEVLFTTVALTGGAIVSAVFDQLLTAADVSIALRNF